MGINSTEVSYGFGQMGSAYTTASSAAITPPEGMVFVAITVLTDTELNTLTATDSSSFINSSSAGSGGTGGLIFSSAVTIPAGVTLYGRWTEVDVNSGAVVAYIGY